MAIRTKHLIGRGLVAGLGCYFRVYYSLEYIIVAATQVEGSPLAPGASEPKEMIRGVVEPPPGVSLPVGQIMNLTLEDGAKIRITADPQGAVRGVDALFR